MYGSHSKNINRNKSFHPLTFANLSKVENKLAEADSKKQEQEKRAIVLRREQEEDRYEELQLNAAAPDSLQAKAAKFRKVEWIFQDEGRAPVAGTETARLPSSSSSGLMMTSDAVAGPLSKQQQGAATKDAMDRKRGREDEPMTAVPSSSTSAVKTGAVTTSEANRYRAEYERLKKAKNDPLALVEAHRNRTVAMAAKSLGHSVNNSSVQNEDQRSSENNGVGASVAPNGSVSQGTSQADAIRQRLLKLAGKK